MAYSLPYGVFAPAEVYDLRRLQSQRADLGYLAHRAAPKGGLDPRNSPRARLHQHSANPRQNHLC
ncbi:MAG TPA: glucosylglycerol hydrolase [Nodosilinea sp.]|nr:glucosylglycerol hydrolase [Nodosilinea sp.]